MKYTTEQAQTLLQEGLIKDPLVVAQWHRIDEIILRGMFLRYKDYEAIPDNQLRSLHSFVKSEILKGKWDLENTKRVHVQIYKWMLQRFYIASEDKNKKDEMSALWLQYAYRYVIENFEKIEEPKGSGLDVIWYGIQQLQIVDKECKLEEFTKVDYSYSKN